MENRERDRVSQRTEPTEAGLKNRETSGSVIVIGPPFSIWRWKRGRALPALPSTLPNLTIRNFGSSKAVRYSSQILFVAPMRLFGRTALSVEMKMKASTACAFERLARRAVPMTLLVEGRVGVGFRIRARSTCRGGRGRQGR